MELEPAAEERIAPVKREYTAYPRQFQSWRWYKPIFVLLLFAVFYLAFSVVAVLAGGGLSGDLLEYIYGLAGGYDTMDVFTAPGVTGALGSEAGMLPALALAGLIMKDRPWSSYSSCRGGWRWNVFGVCLAVGFVVYALPSVVSCLLEGDPGPVRFTAGGLILLTVLGPLQCAAEEYAFRGLIMQSVGSWFRLPVLAIVLQAAAFAAGHPYNLAGVISIAVSGLAFGTAAWLTGGLEASSAMHIMNNMAAFYLTGFGLAEIGSDITTGGLLMSVGIDAVGLLVLLILKRKTRLFDRTQRDDIAPFDAKRRKRKERKGSSLELRQDAELVKEFRPVPAAETEREDPAEKETEHDGQSL